MFFVAFFYSFKFILSFIHCFRIVFAFPIFSFLILSVVFSLKVRSVLINSFSLFNILCCALFKWKWFFAQISDPFEWYYCCCRMLPVVLSTSRLFQETGHINIIYTHQKKGAFFSHNLYNTVQIKKKIIIGFLHFTRPFVLKKMPKTVFDTKITISDWNLSLLEILTSFTRSDVCSIQIDNIDTRFE